MTVAVEGRRLVVDGSAVPLLSGEVHYWRLDRRFWRSVLEAVRDCGLTMVGTYVPWRVHEPRRGTFDFGAAPGSSLDLAAFLHLCRQLGLYVFLRPGPLIVSEMVHGGLPGWLFEDRMILTHNAQGEVATFGAFADAGSPCYLHPAYLGHVRAWLKAVNRVVRPFLHTNGGPIVLVQLDNEISMICLHSCFAGDYNPVVAETGGLYQRRMERK